MSKYSPLFPALLLAACCTLLATTAPPAAAPSQTTAAAPVKAGSAKPATEATRKANLESTKNLNFQSQEDWADARRGFIAPLPNNGRILNREGKETWNLENYSFLTHEGTPAEAGLPAGSATPHAAPAAPSDIKAKSIPAVPASPSGPVSTPQAQGAPDTVNPSLWRQSQLIMQGGLFKVTERLYQVRNADISNMTIIEGDTGLIIADPLISAENAAAALELYYQHRPKKPVKYVIYSHSHVDHYGGVEGVTSKADVQTGKVGIIAPAGFMEAAISENVMAGTAMRRRAQYMYGSLLPPSPTGHVGSGLGLKNSIGSTGLIPPTDIIERDNDTRKLDGLTFIFQLAPDTEAPAEMHWYIPELKALTAAENCTHTMHNLYTLRGAKTRDPIAWARALDITVERFGKEAEVLYGMHHWPVWGHERVLQMLSLTSDLYRYINNQTLHMANKGQTMLEIAEDLRLPPELERVFAMRGYYGSLSHDVKAVYNFYLGWFDGNPAHLHTLPPVAAARKYVSYMGGAQAIIEKARQDYARGEYRWVAQVLDHVIFADPANMPARELAADALEQLGYQAESGPWRNFYLSGARDLRHLPPAHDEKSALQAEDTQSQALPPELYFANLGVRLDGQRAQGKHLTVWVNFTDLRQLWRLEVRNAVLHAAQVEAPAQTDESALPESSQALRGGTTIAGTLAQVIAILDGRKSLEAAKDGLIQGDAASLGILLSLLDSFTPNFALVEP